MKTIIGILLLISPFLIEQELDGDQAGRMKPALVIVDIQNEYLPKMSEQEKKIRSSSYQWFDLDF